VTAGSRIVPARRPGWPRVLAFAALLVAVSWSLGAFSAWPWRASDAGAAVLRISLRHVTPFSGAVTRRTAEEIAALPPHMRPKDATQPATGRRADAVLTVAFGETRVLERRYRPTGLRRDGPVYAYEELPVAPGRHAITVTLADGLPGGREWSWSREVDFSAGSAPLVEYTVGAGWHAESVR